MPKKIQYIIKIESAEKLFIYRFVCPYTRRLRIFVSLHKKMTYMYQRKIPIDLDCPLRLTISLIDSKWKSCILDELRYRSMRPSELHKALPEATPRVLDLQLKELVDDGLVNKTIFPELPPRSEYSISELGMSLIPIIDDMLRWGEEHKELFEKKYGKHDSK